MKFIDLPKPGGPEAMIMSEGPIPKPGPEEVLIKVAAAGVNRPDVHQRQGSYPPPQGASPILGLEVAGEITAVGNRAPGSWSIGDMVCALVPGGGYAEYCVTPAVQCLPIPENLSVEEGAAIPETFFTVWANIFQRGRLRSGDRILIHGGAGGIGTTAIQLAKAFGAEVFVTAGTDGKCEECVKLGADTAINYKTDDFVKRVLEQTRDHGVDVILDIVGGSYVERNIKALALEGRLIQVALLEKSRVEVDLRQVMFRRLTITGSTMRPLPVEKKQKIAEELHEKVWPLIESGKIKPKIDKVFPFKDVAKAHSLLESSKHFGKIVLRMN
jgi:putative PIG3 family NAD(P)H quinone oxidoreductase